MGRDSANGPPRSGGENLAVRYRAMWKGPAEPDVFRFLEEHPQAAASERVEVILHDLERRHEIGAPRRVEEYFQRIPDIPEPQKLAVIEQAFRLLDSPDVDEFVDRFPEFSREKLRRRLLESDRRSTRQLDARQVEPAVDDPYSSDEWKRALGTEAPSESAYALLGDGCSPSGSTLSILPERIGKLRIKRVLKVTGFKEVYIAHHDGLDLEVVVKRARPGVGLILEEARILARMDHPGIVKVFDADQEADGRGYLVEQLIDGTDLADRISECLPSHEESTNLIAFVAEALQHVHTAGVFHRDIKPANILIDRTGRPRVTDFGLALKVEDLGDEEKQGGTVIYMSPEQARGEGHLVDGRTDIYSLGLVFYELLTGVRTVDGSSVSEVLEKIKSVEIRPPRQIDDSIPEELERICLKAASKRASDRYNTALDMAADLRRFLERERSRAQQPELAQPAPGPEKTRRPETRVPVRAASPRILHKGLRSFDKEDADFFPELLPGPRDSDGLPESIRFWKVRIEDADPDRTFRVGLMYGPSGCGKSSLLRAGLLPRLSDRIIRVAVDATRESTEATLLGRVRRRIPNLDRGLDLRGTLSELREGMTVPPGKKVLLVIDQFEQWLHGDCSVETAELTQALRHCDGEHLQCLLLLRDDFWMAITRFMRELEIPLQEGSNSAAVDLFDLRHARKVLTAFGWACDRLPRTDDQLTKDQGQYLDLAVSGLAENGVVIPVRLALFAEMVKSRAWVPRALREVGGALGVGVAFLEETFSAPNAPPEHRRQQKAARAVLRALLPDPGADIKGHMQSRRELLKAAGYFDRPRDFEELMRILDAELRLLTPVGPESVESSGSNDGGKHYYQLTHDYLVPSLREWLTRKRRETRRGRAEIRLEEFSSISRTNAGSKVRPTLWEFLSMIVFARPLRRTPGQRQVILDAGRFHAIRILTLLGVIGLGYLATVVWRERNVDRWIEQAETLWGSGKDHWSEACEHLALAYRESPDDRELHELLKRVSSVGALIVRTVPGNATIRVASEPRKGEAPIQFATRSFQSGQRIRLPIGPYRVTVESDDLSWSFPVLIGQRRYAREIEGWKEADKLKPEDVSVWSPSWQQSSKVLKLAVEETVERVVLVPTPEGYCYVNPGDFWCSRYDTQFCFEELDGKPDWFKARGVTTFEVVPDHLDLGFFIGEDEVSVAEFAAWFRSSETQIRKWLVEVHHAGFNAVGSRDLHYRTATVPAEVLRERWHDELLAGDFDPESLPDRDALCHAMATIKKKEWVEKFDKFTEDLAAQLGGDLSLPVLHVSLDMALLYARTHAFDSPEFRSWLTSEVKRTRKFAAAAKKLHEKLEANSSRFLDVDSIRAHPKFLSSRSSLHDFEWRSLEKGYVYWLYHEASFAAQAPVDAICQWARDNLQGLGSSLFDRLDEIERKFDQDPWLHLRASENAYCKKLVELYAQQIADEQSEHPARIDRANFLLWLEIQVTLQARRLERLTRLQRDYPAAGFVASAIPWDIRLEYGWAMGWTLPSVRQWEKAFRGADARPYPWGYQPGDGHAHTGPDEGGPMALGKFRIGMDRSPYGVWNLAGNVSEWVLAPDSLDRNKYDYLKGGNWLHPGVYENAGCMLVVKRLHRGEYAGFRVVRTIFPPESRK